MKLKTLNFYVSNKDAGTPSDAQLAQINKFTLVPLSADQVYIRTTYLAHNGIDRDGEYFSDALLEEFVKTLPGRGLFSKHPLARDGDSGPGAGIWFSTNLQEYSLDQARELLKTPDLQFAPNVTRAKLLEASFYIPRDTGEDTLIKKIDAGVAGYVSIGFRANGYTPVKDAAGNVMAFQLDPPGEALEGSIVWIGAQPGARVTKQLEDEEEETAMFKDLNQANARVKELEGNVVTLEGDNKTLKTKAGQVDQIKSVLSIDDSADVVEAIKTIMAQAADGKAYREDLVEEVIKAKRLLGMLGDDDQAAKDAKAFYAGMKVGMIKSELAGLQSKIPTGSQLDGSDPNTAGAKPGETSTKDVDDAQAKEFDGILENQLV